MKNKYFTLVNVFGLLFAGTFFSGCEFVIGGMPLACSVNGDCQLIGDPNHKEEFENIEARNLIEIEKNGVKRLLLGTNFDPGCRTLESMEVSANAEDRDRIELSMNAVLTSNPGIACAAIYRSNPLWYDVTNLLRIGDKNVKVSLDDGRLIHLNPTELHWAATMGNNDSSTTPALAQNAGNECRAARHLQFQVRGDEARFDGIFMPQISDPLRPVINPAAQTKTAEVSESHMTLLGGSLNARYTQALGAKIPFVEMLNSPVARDQASQIDYLSLKIALTEVEGRTVQNIDLIVERDQVVDIEALKTELGVGKITLISDDSNLCVQ